MKPFLYILFILQLSLYSQNQEVDSLKAQLAVSQNAKEKARLNNEISSQFMYSDPQQMLEYGRKALTIAQNTSQKLEEGNAYLNIGTAYIILGQYEKSLDHFVWAKSVFEAVDSNEYPSQKIEMYMARTYGSIGIVFSEQSNYTRALEYYFKSVSIYERLKDEGRSAKIYNNIGVAYRAQNENQKALNYFLKSLEIQKKLSDPNIGITLTNIANIYFNQTKFDLAFEFYTEAKKNIEKYPNPRALGEWFNNIGMYYKARNYPQEAKSSWENAINTFNNIEDKFGLTDTYYYLAELYLEQNQTTKALDNANTALSLAKDIEVLEIQVKTEQLLSNIYEKRGETTEALEHLKQQTLLKDSLVKINNNRKAIEATLSYEFEKKELLRKEESEKRELLLKEEAKNSRMMLIAGALILILILGISFLIYNRSTLKKTLTLQKELAEYEQKALHLQMNPHFVFNCLGSISSFIVQNGTDSAIKYLSKFSKLMRLTLEYSKASLIPIDKEIEGLDNYLQLEQLRFNDKFNYSITKDPKIEDDVALPPLLIQPFIENAIIHGVMPKKEEGRISISFSIEEESLVCVILDDGIGINTSVMNKENSVLAHKSMALGIIKKRLEMISESTDQKASIQTEELKKNNQVHGTKVTLWLPLRYINE
jgi:tetratricopeptide (TPR) repeat protein